MAPEVIHALDFRHGTVKALDERTPPRGWPADARAPVEPLPPTPGYTLAALGTPPPSR